MTGIFPILSTHYGNWPNSGTQWVQYTWPKAISTNKCRCVLVAGWSGDPSAGGVPAEVLEWQRRSWRCPTRSGLGVAGDQFNETTFDEITTDQIRLEMDSAAGTADFDGDH